MQVLDSPQSVWPRVFCDITRDLFILCCVNMDVTFSLLFSDRPILKSPNPTAVLVYSNYLVGDEIGGNVKIN